MFPLNKQCLYSSEFFRAVLELRESKRKKSESFFEKNFYLLSYLLLTHQHCNVSSRVYIGGSKGEEEEKKLRELRK